MLADEAPTKLKGDVRSALRNQSKEHLVILAKKLRLRHARKLTKEELIEQMLLLPESTIRRELKTTWWDKLHNHIYGVAGVLGLLLTALSAVYVFVPKVSVEASRTSSIKDPFQSVFVLKNESLFSVKNVQLSYYFNNVEGVKDFPETGVMKQRTRIVGGIRVKSPDDKQPISDLARGESTSLIFPRRFLDDYSYCDIQVDVSYRPALAFWRQREAFRFVTRLEQGALVWYQMAKAEPVYLSPNSNQFLHILPLPSSDPGKIILNRVDPE